MNERMIAAFRGHARCRRESGAVQWSLTGIDRDDGVPLEVLLSGAAALQLPAELAAAELYVSDEAGNARWELRSGGRVIPTGARAAQVHRGAAAACARVLPGFSAPWTARAGWLLLLNALRVPGMAQLLRRLRSRGAA
jgi:hypothetical protein